MSKAPVAEAEPADREAGASPIDAARLDMDSALLAAEIGAYGREPSLPKLLRFGVVGTIGFGWDVATVYLARPVVGLNLAVLLAFFVAATMNFLLNRAWTFRTDAKGISFSRQWALYMLANSFGFMLNRSAVYGLMAVSPLFVRMPVLALAAGAGASLLANFTLSQRFVFRRRVD